MRIVWVQIHSDQNSINEGGSNKVATPLVKKICIETAPIDACPNNTGTRSISSCFLMQQTAGSQNRESVLQQTAGSQNRESLLQQAARIPNPNSVDVEMELDQTTNPNSMDVEMEVEETSDPNSVDVEMDV